VTCDDAQEQLTALGFTRRTPAPPERWEPALRAHVAGCAACSAHLRFLRALSASLATELPTTPSPELLARTRARAVRALRAQAPPRELARPFLGALAVSLLALPVAAGHAWLVIEAGRRLLASWLPEPLLAWLGLVYFGSIALALGALYALVPLGVALARHAARDGADRASLEAMA